VEGSDPADRKSIVYPVRMDFCVITIVSAVVEQSRTPMRKTLGQTRGCRMLLLLDGCKLPPAALKIGLTDVAGLRAVCQGARLESVKTNQENTSEWEECWSWSLGKGIGNFALSAHADFLIPIDYADRGYCLYLCGKP